MSRIDSDQHSASDSHSNGKKPVPPQGSAPGQPGGGVSYGYYAGDPSVYGMEAEPGLDLVNLLRILWRQKLVILVMILLSAFGALFYLKNTEPLYEAKTQVELSMRRPRIGGQQDAVIDDTSRISSAEAFNTQILKLQSATLRQAVAKKLAATPLFEVEPLKDLEDYLEKSVQITLVRQSQMVDITARHTDPRAAAAVVNAYADEALRSALEANREASENAVKWLLDQADTQRQVLEKAEGELLAYKAEKGVEDLSSRGTMTRESLLSVNLELTKLETELEKQQKSLEVLRSLVQGSAEAGQVPSDTPRIEQITEKMAALAKAEGERENLLEDYTQQHPEVLAKDREIERLEQELNREVNNAIQSVNSNVTVLQQQVQALGNQKNTLMDESVRLEQESAQVQSELLGLERQMEASEVSYRGILNRIEEARLSADENTATIQISEPAQIPDTPVHPRPLLTLALALFLGVGAGGVFGLGLHWMQDKVWHPGEVEKGTNTKILGIIPRVRKKEREALGRMSQTDKFSPLSEAVGSIRSFLVTSGFGKCLLVTSSAPSEGKSITASNLAISWAKSGHRTILIDLDMRRPKVKEMWGITEKDADKSLLHALADKNAPDWATIVHQTDQENLSIIVSHHETKISPSEVLSTERTMELIEWARKSYDRVILDSPPIGVASDSIMLGALADGVVLVGRYNQSRKHALKSASRRLTDSKANLLGIVINDVPLNRGRLSYDYGLYEPYHGYHYDYHK
jgi:succinoglycan biosynthesis transport protein ExoP